MGDNKCKNENTILDLAKSVIKDTITKDTNPIKDIFSYTFKESYSTATKYNHKFTSYISNASDSNSSNSSSGSVRNILAQISAFIVAAIIFIGLLFNYFIKAIFSYLENNLLYKFINIKLFRTIDNYERYYNKFILLSDGLIDLKKKGEESVIKNIIDNRIEKILQDRLNGYLKDIGKIDKEYIEDRERKGREKKEDKERELKQNIADENNRQSADNTATTAANNFLTRVTAATITAAAKGGKGGLMAGVATLATFFGRWSDTIAGFFILILCIVLIILVIYEVYSPSEIIDKAISEKIEEKRNKYSIKYKNYTDNTFFASLSRIPEKFQLLFDEIQFLYQSFVKRIVFFKTFSSEFINDARNYTSYPIELSREEIGGIHDNIYTFDYDFIKELGDSTDDGIYNKGSKGNSILLIKPMDLEYHAKEIYGQAANLSKLNTDLVLEQDGSNYKYKIQCVGTEANNIFSSNCAIKDIDNICGPEKQEQEDDYSKIQ
jgi:hypothetical protein